MNVQRFFPHLLKFRSSKKKKNSIQPSSQKTITTTYWIWLFVLVCWPFCTQSFLQNLECKNVCTVSEGFQPPERVVLYQKNNILNDHRKLAF